MKYSLVLLAAGKGERLNLGYNKVMYHFNDGKTIIQKSLEIFIDDPDLEEVILVVNEQSDIEVDDSRIRKVYGGATRRDSVRNGLNEVKCDYVLIHDGARPYLKKEHLQKVKEALKDNDAVILGVYSKDTVKEVSDGYVKKTLDRNNIFLVQTPQAFKTSLIRDAYNTLKDSFTDDSSLLESLGIPVKVVVGDYSNIKITYKEDLADL